MHSELDDMMALGELETSGEHMDVLKVKIRRNHIFQDGFHAFRGLQHKGLKNRLYIVFFD